MIRLSQYGSLHFPEADCLARFAAIKLEVRHTIPQIAISARKSGAALSIFLKLLVVIASYTKYIIMDSTIKIIIKLVLRRGGYDQNGGGQKGGQGD